MADLPVNVGADATMIQDIEAAFTPPNAFTMARNVRFQNGHALRLGSERIIKTQASLAPSYLIPALVPTESLWFVGTPTKAYSLKGSTLTDITRASGGNYGGGNWIGGMFSGSLVVTNGIDVPQTWTPPAAATALVPLVNWPSGWLARVVRPYLRVLVAMGISVSGAEKPYLLAWSALADPGALPPSWDPTDPTKDVGNVDLADTEDFLVDGLALGQSFVIYKGSTTWLMYPYGGGGGGLNTLFRIQGLFRESGLLARNCVCEFGGDAQGRGSKHFVATGDDVIVNNGQAAQSILTSRLRKWLNNNLSGSAYAASFALTHDQEHEVRFYFPQQGSTVPDLVLVWNWDTNGLSIGNTTPIRHAAFGRYDTVSDAFDSVSGSFGSDFGAFDAGASLSQLHQGLGAGADSIYAIDDQTFGSPATAFTAKIERLDFPYVRGDQGPAPAFDNFKFYKWFWPRFSAPAGTTFVITFGAREDVSDNVPIVWGMPQNFVAGVDRFVSCNLNTKYLSYRIECAAQVAWKFHGFTLGVQPRGIHG